MTAKDAFWWPGAGPVGLFAVVSLLMQGIPVTVLEASPDLPIDLRLDLLSATLDFLDGLTPAMNLTPAMKLKMAA